MTSLKLPEVALTIVIAFCCASAGDMLLGRRSKGLREWNESFIIGLVIMTAALFPLSILVPAHALAVLAISLLACGLWRTRVWFIEQRATGRAHSGLRRRTDWVSIIVLTFISAFVMKFVYLDLVLAYEWDGFLIWATKAYVLYLRGGMSREFLVPGQYEMEIHYPFMVPLFEAFIAVLRGAFEWEAVKPVFIFFFLSMLVSTYYALRGLVTQRIALACTGLLASIPGMTTGFAVKGFADVPQACVVAAVLTGILGGNQPNHPDSRNPFRRPLPWLIAGLLFVKSEGTLLYLVAISAVATTWLSEGVKMFLIRLRQQWAAASIVAAAGLHRILTLTWAASPLDIPVYHSPLEHGELKKALALGLTVPKICLAYLMNFRGWGFLWPAMGLAVIILLVIGRRSERLLALATMASLAVYTMIFDFTTWDIRNHIATAYDRLLIQLSPLAVVVIGIAIVRLSGGRVGHSETDGG